MIVYSKAALKIAQNTASDAVKIGSKEGELDWVAAMAWLKIATGHAEIQQYDSTLIQGILASMGE